MYLPQSPLVLNWINMIDLKKFVCPFLLIFSVASMCKGDEILDKLMAVVDEKYNTRISTLEEENIQKEKRISVLERKNLELITENESLKVNWFSNNTRIQALNHSELEWEFWFGIWFGWNTTQIYDSCTPLDFISIKDLKKIKKAKKNFEAQTQNPKLPYWSNL